MRVSIPDETLIRLRKFEETTVKERTDVDYKSLYKTVNNAVVILSNEIYGLADKINATENLPEQIKYTHQLAGVAQEWEALRSLKRFALNRYHEKVQYIGLHQED